MIKALVSAIVLATTWIQPKTITEPTVRDAKPPIYVVENPKFYPATLFFDCGSDFDEVVLAIPARAKQTYEIKTSLGTAPYCMLIRWEKKK